MRDWYTDDAQKRALEAKALSFPATRTETLIKFAEYLTRYRNSTPTKIDEKELKIEDAWDSAFIETLTDRRALLDLGLVAMTNFHDVFASLV